LTARSLGGIQSLTYSLNRQRNNNLGPPTIIVNVPAFAPTSPPRAGVVCCLTGVSGSTPPSLPSCPTAASMLLLPTANGSPTSRISGLRKAAVVDLFSRRVVGWSMSAAITAQLVTDALVMAIRQRGKPDALMHHSDRVSQYTSEQFQRLMADHGVVCSMSLSGNVWDNAAMESFFSSLKTERTARKLSRKRDEAKADVFDYVERVYNAKRRHSTIGY
jgi:transposase InsO family protein